MVEARLHDRHLAPGEFLDLVDVDVAAHDLVAEMGKTGARREAHVPGTDNGDTTHNDPLYRRAVTASCGVSSTSVTATRMAGSATPP